MMNKNTNTTSWTWYKAWTNTLVHPNEDTWNALVSEGNVSFGRAYIWLTIVSLLFPLAYSTVVWIGSPLSINSSNVWIFIRNTILIGILEPIGFVVLTRVVHFLAKLFSKSGNYSNFFVISATSFAPLSLLRTLTTVVRWTLAFKPGLYAGTILAIYFVAFLMPMIVKFNYQLNLLLAFLMSVGLAFLVYYLSIAIYTTTGFGI
jgi:hypothetical protein